MKTRNIVKCAIPVIPFSCILIAIGSLFLTGCASQMMIAKGPGFEASTRATYMILPFGDANAPAYRLKYQNAADVVRDALESAFMEQGFKTIHCPEALSSDAVHGEMQTVTADLSTEKLSDENTKQHFEAKGETILGKQGISEGQAVAAGKQGGG